MRYLDYQLTSWGRMFIDTNNKESYLSNYAVIYKNCNIDDAIAEIEKYHNTVYISNVYTTPSERRKGYGMAVINKIILHYSDCFIYLYTNNPEAANIYRKLGFSDNHLKSWWAIKGSLPDWCSTNNKKEQ